MLNLWAPKDHSKQTKQKNSWFSAQNEDLISGWRAPGREWTIFGGTMTQKAVTHKGYRLCHHWERGLIWPLRPRGKNAQDKQEVLLITMTNNPHSANLPCLRMSVQPGVTPPTPRPLRAPSRPTMEGDHITASPSAVCGLEGGWGVGVLALLEMPLSHRHPTWLWWSHKSCRWLMMADDEWSHQ